MQGTSRRFDASVGRHRIAKALRIVRLRALIAGVEVERMFLEDKSTEHFTEELDSAFQ
jgi:hypothetical protein